MGEAYIPVCLNPVKFDPENSGNRLGLQPPVKNHEDRGEDHEDDDRQEGGGDGPRKKDRHIPSGDEQSLAKRPFEDTAEDKGQ